MNPTINKKTYDDQEVRSTFNAVDNKKSEHPSEIHGNVLTREQPMASSEIIPFSHVEDKIHDDDDVITCSSLLSINHNPQGVIGSKNLSSMEYKHWSSLSTSFSALDLRVSDNSKSSSLSMAASKNQLKNKSNETKQNSNISTQQQLSRTSNSEREVFDWNRHFQEQSNINANTKQNRNTASASSPLSLRSVPPPLSYHSPLSVTSEHSYTSTSQKPHHDGRNHSFAGYDKNKNYDMSGHRQKQEKHQRQSKRSEHHQRHKSDNSFSSFSTNSIDSLSLQSRGSGLSRGDSRRKKGNREHKQGSGRSRRSSYRGTHERISSLGSLSENSCSPHGYQSQKRKDQRSNTNVAKSDISHHSSFSVADVPSLLPLSSGDTIHGSQSFYSYGNKNANEGDMHSTSSSSSTHCSNALRSMIPNKKHANANFHNYHSREDSDSFLSASGIVSSSIYSDPSSGCSDDKTVHSYCLTQSSFKPDRYFNNSTFLGDSRLAVHRYETSSESEDRDPESESSWGDDVAEKSFLDYLETQGDLKRSEVTLESESNSKPSNPQFKTKFSSPKSKRKEWLLRMNRKISEIPVGDLDPNDIPLNALMNAWAKTKSNEGASMVEMLLNRAQAEVRAGNNHDGVQLSTKMYTMAVDAWAKSGEGENGAKRAEAILHHMNKIYISGYQYHLKPTTGIFNAVINAWARSNSANAPKHAEEIMEWMNTLYQNGNADVRPDKYTFNTVMHAWAKSGGKEAAVRAQKILDHMHHLYEQNEFWAKPDTITYNVVINAWAKSGCDSAANEAETLLRRMHFLYDRGNLDIKPNVVTYGAVIDAYAKSLEVGAASKADQLLANMIKLYQSDPKINVDLRPNTFIFNTVINCWAKSEEEDSASKAEEMLVAMGTLYQNGIPDIKPDAFTYTAVIDAWAKSGYQGAASRADKLLKEMESKYIGGETDLKPNTFTYNAVINALAKSGEAGAAGRAEQVLQNMVNRYNNGGSNDAKPTTINFNTVLDAWAKSGGGTAAAERSEKILEWMYELHGSGNVEVQPDTITFNAVIDAWARSGDKKAPVRAEQILHYMNQLYSTGNKGVKPDSYTYNTLINSWAKSGDKGAAKRASEILSEMQLKYEGGDTSVKPNTRTYTSVIDAWAKSGESMAAKKAEQILIRMQALYERSFDDESKPNSHTANAVMNACAFTKIDADKSEALSIAFRTFDWLTKQERLEADAYTFTIMLSVCSNLLPRQDRESRYAHASNLFMRCCDSGHVNDFVLRKLRQTVTEEEYMSLVRYGSNMTASKLPRQWTRNTRFKSRIKGTYRASSNQTRRKRH